MWGAVGRDHHHAGLIWNETTRAELRLALQVCDSVLRHEALRLIDNQHLALVETQDCTVFSRTRRQR